MPKASFFGLVLRAEGEDKVFGAGADADFGAPNGRICQILTTTYTFASTTRASITKNSLFILRKRNQDDNLGGKDAQEHRYRINCGVALRRG